MRGDLHGNIRSDPRGYPDTAMTAMWLLAVPLSQLVTVLAAAMILM